MFPLRLVIDTNMLISAAIKLAGLQRTVSAACHYQTGPPVGLPSHPGGIQRSTCPPELKIRKGLRWQLLQLIKNHSYTVAATRRLEVAGDPDDNMFLQCADAARADDLVTGNQKHFPRFWKQTKVISSREFISIVTPHLIA